MIQLAQFYDIKRNCKTNNIVFSSSTGWEPWRLIKGRSDPFHNTWLKNLLSHTHGHIIIFKFKTIKSSRFALQCYYNRWRLIGNYSFLFVPFFSTLEILYSQKIIKKVSIPLVLHWVIKTKSTFLHENLIINKLYTLHLRRKKYFLGF